MLHKIIKKIKNLETPARRLSLKGMRDMGFKGKESWKGLIPLELGF